MKNYQSIQPGYDDESNEDDALINRPTPIPDRSPFYKRYPLIAVVALCFLLAYNLVGTNQDNATYKADAAAFLQDNPPIECETKDDCGSGKFCCNNKCQSCCEDRDCTQKMEFRPPAGEFGEKLCINEECTAYKNGESSQIPPEGYPVYTPSETLDNSKKFRKYSVPRTVYDGDGPIMEQVWRIDFSQQDESFDKDNKFEYNSSHITIPSFDHLHAAYSRSYNHFDEHETGISTLIMADNEYSLVADFPKIIFIEKYHTLTYDGKIDTARGDYIKNKAQEQMGEQPAFDKAAWKDLAELTARALGAPTNAVQRQVEAGLDQAIAMQVRRYADSYPEDDFGSLNANTSDSWAKHSELAKKAIDHAKDPSFERDYLKSELHCKHFEEMEGMSFTEDTITFPLGRPITGFSGEMVNSPVHYFGIGVGYITLEYDPNTQILEIFYQTFAHTRQHSDVAFPGPYPNGLYVTPVSDGDDYAVSSTRDGRTDGLFLSSAPPDTTFGGEADFTLWARQTEDFCDEELLPLLNQNDGNAFDYGTEAEFQQQNQIIFPSVCSMPCATTYMRTDYGGGTNFDVQDFGVWYHSFVEVRPGRNEEMLTATFWDEWQCFYADKCD